MDWHHQIPENEDQGDLEPSVSFPVSMAPTRPGPGDIDHPLFRYPQNFDRETQNRPFLDDSDDVDSESSDDETDSESGEGSDDEAVEIDRVPSAVRRLSRKHATDKPSLDSYQDAQVVRFVEYGLNTTPESTEGTDPPLVALVDDQTDTMGGQPCRGGLTRSGLVEVIEKPACTMFQLRVFLLTVVPFQRFRVPGVAPGHFTGAPVDIKRRVM